MKRKRGRPRKKISEKEVEKLAKYGLNNSEIADILGCDEGTIRKNFSEFLTKGRAELKKSLRRKQIASAIKGNVIMLIWLGKQYLGQKEKIEESGEIKIIVERKKI